MFTAFSGNQIKGESDESMVKLAEAVQSDYGEETVKTLIREIYPVASDPLQIAAQCLNSYLMGDTIPIDPADHPAVAANIENLLKKYKL